MKWKTISIVFDEKNNKFYLDRPKIIGERFEKNRVQSKITELECVVDSNPSPQFSFINWIFLGSQFNVNDAFEERNHKNYSCNQVKN